MLDVQGKALPPYDAAYVTSDDSELLTIPGLFSYALKTIWKKPPELRVTYDPVFGYPAMIYVDPYTEPCCQEFTIKVREFQVLP